VVTANQCLADAEQGARCIWHYKSTVFLDKMMKFVLCALDKCYECALVSGSACVLLLWIQRMKLLQSD